MKILFDLDGTLIDSKLRLYNLFQSLVLDSELSFDDYWGLKSNKINHYTILKDRFNYTDEKIKDFESTWMTEIEKDVWLDYDKPFEGLHHFLANLRDSGYELYLVTARQSDIMALKQLQKLGIDLFFKKILVTNQIKDKFDLIKETILVDHNDWIVGDTGKDVETGKKLGIRTAAVLSGFLNKKHLVTYDPDIIADSVLNIDFKNI